MKFFMVVYFVFSPADLGEARLEFERLADCVVMERKLTEIKSSYIKRIAVISGCQPIE